MCLRVWWVVGESDGRLHWLQRWNVTVKMLCENCFHYSTNAGPDKTHISSRRLYVLWRRFCFVQLCVVVA